MHVYKGTCNTYNTLMFLLKKFCMPYAGIFSSVFLPALCAMWQLSLLYPGEMLVFYGDSFMVLDIFWSIIMSTLVFVLQEVHN